MTLLLFLFKVVAISLSGVMAPGPVTAATIAMSARSRYAGMLIAVGHGVVELPLIVLIVLGADRILKLPAAQIIIGLAGGAFLLLMGVQMLRALRSAEQLEAKFSGKAPLLTGILLSATNPYFLFWWATIGLALATAASGLGGFGRSRCSRWFIDSVISSGCRPCRGRVPRARLFSVRAAGALCCRSARWRCSYSGSTSFTRP